MTGEPHSDSRSLSTELLSELVRGGPGLPSARDRWRALLTDPSPQVRLAAEVALLAQIEAKHEPSSEIGHRPMTPHRVPQYGITEPKRHCLRCFGHDFWVNASGRLHCEQCEPMPTV